MVCPACGQEEPYTTTTNTLGQGPVYPDDSYSPGSFGVPISSDQPDEPLEESIESIPPEEFGRAGYRKARNTTYPSTTIPISLERKRIEPGKNPDSGSSGRPITATTYTLPENRICGATEYVCSVEYDADANGKPDCCNPENHPVCAGCLEHCMSYCAGENAGVISCFGNSSTKILCQCSDNLPSCYRPLNPQTTTTLGDREKAKGTSPMTYLMILAIGFIALVAAVKFAHKIG
ncbi:MAG: hypothetical protein V1875_03035 [Candidatus Altiarchaeota archaeon]